MYTNNTYTHIYTYWSGYGHVGSTLTGAATKVTSLAGSGKRYALAFSFGITGNGSTNKSLCQQNIK